MLNPAAIKEGFKPQGLPDNVIMTTHLIRDRKVEEVERTAYRMNEVFEAIGGLINAVEKLLMPIITFFSFRMFWIKIVEDQFHTQEESND